MNRLRSYRDIEGISQEELGMRLGISTQMVSAIEKGQRQFAGSLLPIGYSDERFNVPDMSEPLHRHKASTTVTAKKRAHELLRLGGEVFAELQSRTSRAPTTQLVKQSMPMDLNELEDLSAEVRFLLNLEENGPIQNLTSAIERAGVCIIPIVGLEGVFGLSSWVNGVPVIGISPAFSGDMFRFTLLHEIAHLLYHTKKGDHTEPQAQRVAGAVLFPLLDFEAVMPERPQLRDFIELKSVWGVSVAAIVYRAHELGYIDDSRYRALQIQMSKWRRKEPGMFDPIHGQLFTKLVDVNGGAREVAKELGVSERHVGELLNWSHLRLART